MNGTRIRLLSFLTNFFQGGTERQVVTLARKLDTTVFEQHLACLDRRGEFLRDVDDAGIPLTDYPISRLYGPRTLRQQWRFAQYLRSRHIQIVHTYGFYSHVFAIPAARLAGTPHIVASIRDLGDPWTPAQRRLQGYVCRMAHHVLTNADAVKKQLVADGYAHDNIAVIRNGVDVDIAAPARAEPTMRRALGLPDTAPIVALVSRLSRSRGEDIKGIGYFLEAVRLAAPRCPSARFLVFGDGTSRDAFEADARHRGLEGRVIFVGFRHDVRSLLAEADLSVLPSISEGLPNAVLESMAAGVPTVATRVGGTPEAVVDGVTGLLVPPRDAGALADAMHRLLERPSLARQMGLAARQRARDHFSIERMVQDTERLYSTFVHRPALATGDRLSSVFEAH